MKKFILLLLCFSFYLTANSQTNQNLQISGKVTDSAAQKPISFATIVLKNDKKVQLKSIVSAKDGSFALTGLNSGNYILSIIYIGYQTKVMPVVLGTTSKNLDVVSLSPSPTQLKGVTVTAERALVKQEIDRISYDVKADPESKVNNVLEMMRKVPLLSVDGDDNIQLQGNSNYKILINGRPSGMMERNPKDILRSMPAANIERIEVITTPPAKYDGEGLAGIINIITFKKADNGTNGSVNLNERFPVGGPGIGATFTLKEGKFGISSNVGGNLNSNPLLINTNSRVTQGSNATNLFQSGERDFSGKSAYAGAELSFEIDSLNLISGQFGYNTNKNDSYNSQFSTLNNTAGLLQSYQLTNNSENSGNGFDAAFNYQLGFKKDKNRLLTFSYRYFRFTNDQFNNINVFNKVAYTLPDYRQDASGGSSEQTIQLDFTYPSKKLSIEAGVKIIFRNNMSDYQVFSADPSGAFILDPLRTNAFDNQQNIYGIYNSYQFNIKKWGVKAGLRAEQTQIDANFSNSNVQLNKNSLNFIPSVSFMRKFKNMTSLTFGVTSRIQRPGINQLNPFVDRSNPNFESSGNPDLKPTNGIGVEAVYSIIKKATVNVGFRSIFLNNLIMPSVVIDPTTQITRTSFGNTGSANLIGLNINGNYPINNKLRANLGIMGNYGIIRGEVSGVATRKTGLMRKAFTSLTYRPSKNWQATGSVNYNGPSLSFQGSSNSFVFSSFSISKDFLDNKLSISFAANNVFNKYRNQINYTNGPNFTQESFNQNYQRNFTTSLNYRFGKLKDSIKKNKKGINNNDVSEGTNL